MSMASIFRASTIYIREVKGRAVLYMRNKALADTIGRSSAYFYITRFNTEGEAHIAGMTILDMLNTHAPSESLTGIGAQIEFVRLCRSFLGLNYEPATTSMRRQDEFTIIRNPKSGKFHVKINNKLLKRKLIEQGYYYYAIDYDSEEAASAAIRSRNH